MESAELLVIAIFVPVISYGIYSAICVYKINKIEKALRKNIEKIEKELYGP